MLANSERILRGPQERVVVIGRWILDMPRTMIGHDDRRNMAAAEIGVRGAVRSATALWPSDLDESSSQVMTMATLLRPDQTGAAMISSTTSPMALSPRRIKAAILSWVATLDNAISGWSRLGCVKAVHVVALI